MIVEQMQKVPKLYSKVIHVSNLIVEISPEVTMLSGEKI
jgi:hypothetical protein